MGNSEQSNIAQLEKERLDDFRLYSSADMDVDSVTKNIGYLLEQRKLVSIKYQHEFATEEHKKSLKGMFDAIDYLIKQLLLFEK